MPRPPRKRAARNSVKVLGTAESTADAAKNIAQKKSTRRRPKRSLINPATMAPGMHPKMALAPAKPSCAGVSPKYFVRYWLAPLMTAVS